MKYFELTPELLNIRGQFYPVNQIIALFPGEDAARSAGRTLVEAGISEDGLSLITPEVMMRDVVRSVGSADIPLPSPGTEADTVRRFGQLAAQGHWALMIHAPDNATAERVMKTLEEHQQPPSHAQRYRRLVIEDLA
ncbi:hypothetical protein PE066_20335 [Ramlibacter tataouinensis]|uniref:hypothetical protein n=1 Tax=Ramlibacter tataouinensis TaxID=94132 RepID=UPI0022F392EB|nr:hypothetical protein [Ramlibacter tataouinensis]WBY01768.1 hypothetical protein PE066_20335 [Ramlibacter tataouinensis]